MKKAVVFFSLIFAFTGLSAQSAKTDLSLQVSAAAAANNKQLAAYTWNRSVQVFISGELKTTIVSALSIGPDGKLVTSAVSTTPTSAPKGGLRGKIADDKIADMKTYVDNAVTVSMGYIYMTQGKMVDFFNAATITQSGNVITVSGSNVNQPNDRLVLNLASGSLAFVSRTFSSTVSNGDAVSGTINYQTFSNGLNAVNNAELDLPAKNMKIMIANSNYAQKLQ